MEEEKAMHWRREQRLRTVLSTLFLSVKLKVEIYLFFKKRASPFGSQTDGLCSFLAFWSPGPLQKKKKGGGRILPSFLSTMRNVYKSLGQEEVFRLFWVVVCGIPESDPKKVLPHTMSDSLMELAATGCSNGWKGIQQIYGPPVPLSHHNGWKNLQVLRH